jgi:hypothetical protein
MHFTSERVGHQNPRSNAAKRPTGRQSSAGNGGGEAAVGLVAVIRRSGVQRLTPVVDSWPFSRSVVAAS